MPKIILIHTGQTDWHAQGRLAGDTDLPLNEIGHRQAIADAQAVAGEHPEVVRCGPEQATRQTASIIAHELHLKFRTADALKEVDLGVWEGLTLDDFKERYGKVYKQWRLDPTSIEPPEGESITAAAARLDIGIKKIIKRHKNETVIVAVGHFAFAILRCRLQDKSFEHFWDYVDEEPQWQVIQLSD
jgi:broad specificity phosphatase PhoE